MKRAPSPGALSRVTSPPIERARRARDGEPEAGAAGLGLDPLEALEDALLVGRGDARALVGDGHRCRAGGALESEPHDRCPAGEWRNALPIRLTRIWITAGSWPRAGSAPDVTGSIVTSRSSASDFDHAPRLRPRAPPDRSCDGRAPDPRSSSAPPTAGAARRRQYRCRSLHSRCAAGRRRAP